MIVSFYLDSEREATHLKNIILPGSSIVPHSFPLALRSLYVQVLFSLLMDTVINWLLQIIKSDYIP